MNLQFFRRDRDIPDRDKDIPDVEKLKSEIATLQASLNILLNAQEQKPTRYTGNPYPDYQTKVRALSKAYDGEAEWGSLTVRNIVDVRAAFLIGGGVRAVRVENVKGDAKRELEFLDKFKLVNKISRKLSIDWAREGEIEGKFLTSLTPEDGNIRIRHIPWSKIAYTVETPENEFDEYLRVVYEGLNPFTLTGNKFAYVRFGGRSDQVNTPAPKVSLVLRHIEDLDKALWDWRKINHLYAAPTPDFECDEPSQVDDLREHIRATNWRLGKAIIHTGKFTLVSHNGEGYTTLQNEIMGSIKIISGATGVPVHFLGAVDLVNSKSVADNLLELIVLSTTQERDAWASFYTELFRNAIKLYNESYNNNLDPNAVEAHIPYVSSAKLTEITQVWLPLYVQGALSLETLLSKIPEVNVDLEVERVKQQQIERERRQQQREAREANDKLKFQKDNRNAANSQG